MGSAILTADSPDEEQQTVEEIMDESAEPSRAQSSSIVGNLWIFGGLLLVLIVVVAFLFNTDFGN